MKQLVVTAESQCGLEDIDDPQVVENYAKIKIHAAPLCTEFHRFLRGGTGLLGVHEAAGEVARGCGRWLARGSRDYPSLAEIPSLYANELLRRDRAQAAAACHAHRGRGAASTVAGQAAMPDTPRVPAAGIPC